MQLAKFAWIGLTSKVEDREGVFGQKEGKRNSKLGWFYSLVLGISYVWLHVDFGEEKLE